MYTEPYIVYVITIILQLIEIEAYAKENMNVSLRTKRLTMCSCRPSSVNCCCVLQDKDSRKCTCSRKGTKIEELKKQRYCRCSNTHSSFWNNCKNSCQEKCFESCLNSNSGLKCLEQCGPPCSDACSRLTQEDLQSIKLVVQTRSQCETGCSESCSLSCQNQAFSNRPLCRRACQDVCQKACNSLAPDDTILIDYDSCLTSCLGSCRNSCLSQPGQNLLADECGNECKHTCDRVCSNEQNRRVTGMSTNRKPPEIFVPDEFSRNEIFSVLYDGDIYETSMKSADFNNCFKQCSILCTTMGYDSAIITKYPELCYQTCSEMEVTNGFSNLSGCRASCPVSCTEYCEQRKVEERESCKRECDRACALACRAEIIDGFNRRSKELQNEVEKLQLNLDTAPITATYPTKLHNRPVVDDDMKAKKSRLHTKVSIFPHNRTAILQCQIRCAKYCVENYGGDQCISDCQQSCLEAALEQAREKSLVTTLNIGGPIKDGGKPQILPCNLGAKPTGENCVCADGYTQCGVNQCCRK